MKQSLTQKPHLLLLAEILFTVFAFVLMCVISYIFLKNVVHERMIDATESMLDFEQSRVEADLAAPITASGIFSETVRRMLLRGADVDELQVYIYEISEYMRLNEAHSSSFGGILCYLENLPDGPVLLNDLDADLSTGLPPPARPWYRDAVAAKGDIAKTVIEGDQIFGENVLAYSQCLLDDKGNQMGVVCFFVRLNVIGKSIIDLTLSRGGYGVLLSPDQTVLAHPNEEYVGKHMRDPALTLSPFADELLEKKRITERPMTSWRGESAVAFFRELENGWYLGVIMRKDDYYKSITRMAWMLGTLGAALATVLIVILIRIDRAKNRADFESRQKSAFLANMSHEIRTPMNAIIGMTSIGKSSASEERKDYCFNKIEEASQHLLGVINDILDMSKIEANMFILSTEEYNFEKMLQRVVNVINFRAEEKRIKLTVHIDKNIPKILLGDDQRLAQAITNLLGNAIKFTPEEGAISLSAFLTEENEGVCEIQIEVSDTGIGISPLQQANLFNSFQQAESSTTRKYGGTGLGLAISKSIIEMMGGRIWVESELGNGATFAFTTLAERVAEHPESSAHSYSNLTNTRLLTVDDDAENLVFFQGLMKEFGAYCDTADNGVKALEMIRQKGSYDVYFVSWKIPDMDGIELARELKLLSSPSDVSPVVIMISAADLATFEQDADKAGVSKFLAKPLFPSAIIDSISEILGTKHEEDEALDEQTGIGGIFTGQRLLLAEDVEINREIVMTLLEPTGVEIDCAENGLEAVRMFSAAPDRYEVILMDVQMPKLDGYDATRRIRALGANNAKDIPIIALTANVFREDIEQCINAGMDSHLGKPIDLKKLIKKLREYL